MDEIKVVPYIPDEDYDNPAMVVDFYEFTMANCLFLHGFKDTTLVFDMFFRKNPDNQGYSISAGQRKLTRFLLNYHFNAQDIWWLRTKGMSEEFCEYLRTYQWKGDMYALPEGTVAFPRVAVVHTIHIGTDAAPAGIKGRGQRHRGGIAAAPPQCGDVALTVHPLEPRHNHDLPGLQLPQDAASVQRRDLRGSMVAIGMDAGLPAGKGNSGKPHFLQGHGHQRSGCLLPGGQ